MKDFFKKIWQESPKIRKVIGVILVIVGFISIITPFTPVGFLFFVGLEILGIRLLFWDKLKDWYKNKKNK